MSTLEAALTNVELIYLLYGLILAFYLFVSIILKRRGLLALGLINYAGLLGLAAMIALPFISPFQIDYSTLFTGIFIEIFCAGIFLIVGFRIISYLRSDAQLLSNSMLLVMLAFKVLFFVLNYIAAGGQYGIFSDDSRIDFIQTSPILARTMYLDMIIDFIVLCNITMHCLACRRIKFIDIFILLSVVSLNFMTGSKGATFLLMATVMLFIYAATPNILSRISKKAAAGFVVASVLTVLGYVYLLSESHQVTFEDQINLTQSRFLLSADARIMAFDSDVNRYVLSQAHGEFLSELFRGPARIIGAATAEFPIGVYQYQYQVGTTNYVGSTNQLSAMFVTYGDEYWLREFFVVAGLMILAYGLLSASLKSSSTSVAWVSAASLYWLSTTFSQGFDAFVQLLPISLAIIFLLWVLGSIRFGRKPLLKKPACDELQV